MNPELLLFIAFLALLCVYTFRTEMRAQARRKQLPSMITESFQKAFDTLNLPGLPESPTDLKLIRSDDNAYGEHGLILQSTRLYRVSSEQYLLFICTAGQDGYLKPLSRLEAARHVRTTPKVLYSEFPDMAARVLASGQERSDAAR